MFALFYVGRFHCYQYISFNNQLWQQATACPDFICYSRIQPQFILSTPTVIICWGSLPRYPGASNTEQVPPDLIVPTSAGFFPLHWYYHSARQWSQDLGCLSLISAFLSSVISQQAWSNWPHNISQIALFWQHQCHCPSLGEYRE